MKRPNGIKNIEGTCYMNATIQCLNYIEELTTYLLNLKSIPPDTIILGEYINILKGLRNTSFPCSVTNFRKKMAKVNKLFEGYKGNDPSDLIINFFNTLEDDLKKCAPYKLWFYEKVKNDEDLKEVYDYNISKTILNDLFNYITEEKFCCRCLKSSYNYQTQQFMILNINSDDSIENYLSNNKKQYYSKLTCQNCHDNYLIKNEIKIFPKYLILVLNTVNKYKKYHIDFTEYFDQYEDNKRITYKFLGMIVHLGYNSDSGHFIAYCRNPNKSGEFYKFNDSFVEEVSFEEIKQNSPYILFYKRIVTEKREEEYEKLKYKISGNLVVELPYNNKKLFLFIDLNKKKINFKIDGLIYNDNETSIVNKIITNIDKNSSFFNLTNLDENIGKLVYALKNSLIKI